MEQTDKEVNVSIIIKHKGNFDKTLGFLKRASNINYEKILHRYGKEGVDALSSATPMNTGQTADSWFYTIEGGNGTYTLSWSNSNTNKGLTIAVLIQYGHGTGNGGYVQGIDYINPAMRPIFEKLANDAWREVTNL